MAKQAGEPDGAGSGALQGINDSVIRTLLLGEAAVAAVAVVASLVLTTNPLANFDISKANLYLAAFAALPIFAGSVYLERSDIKLFKDIDRDTQLFILQLFGTKRNVWGILPSAAAMSLAAAVAEELLFRGVLQQWGAEQIGALPALIITSLLFGLAHNPVPGASSLVEAAYGLNFGALYLLSGGNLFACIASHFLYDFATFVEVHLRSTSRHSVAAKSAPGGGAANGANGSAGDFDRKVKDVIANYRLGTPFVKNALAVFKRLDSDQNRSIDRQELQLGIRTFGKFTSPEEIDAIFKRADTNQDEKIEFDEFLRLLSENALQVQRVQGQQQQGGSKGSQQQQQPSKGNRRW